MNHMTLIAHFAARLCARFTVLFRPISREAAFTQQINSYPQAVENAETKVNQCGSYPYA